MEIKINELNNIYEPALKDINFLTEMLKNNNIEFILYFFNNHQIKINNKYIKELYPIPVVSCKIKNIEFDLGVDIIKTNSYVGFVEITLNKKDILNFNFDKLKDFVFEIYGVDNCLTDYFFGDLLKTKTLIRQSVEKYFHIGIDIKSINQFEIIIERFIC